uniref:Uncharacterized protein n=1 Tax=uncultured marine virus TaxID=186617 RepID=A0A0F7L7S2_9VIRU|nr:hypothetical protein [uncultured marine virus]
MDKLFKDVEVKRDDKAPNGEFNATVNLVGEEVGFTDRFGRGYWSKVIKVSGVSYNGMLGILKELKDLPAKYPKGAVLTNKLKKNGNNKRGGTIYTRTTK